MSFLERNDVRLPNNGHLTPSRWQQLGIDFGMRGKSRSSRRTSVTKLNLMQVVLIAYTVRIHLSLSYSCSMALQHLELVFRASNDLAVFKSIAYKTLQIIQGKQDYDGNPLYAIMHESIYCQR